MSEMGDNYDPGPWKQYNYTSARRSYDRTAGRGYDDIKISRKELEKAVPNKLTTQSKYPVVIACDVTGSMAKWPKIIFEKLPLLDLGAKDYFSDPEFSFCAFDDHKYTKLPMQVQEFSKGTDLTDRLKELRLTRKGGNNGVESYHLPALYYANNVDMPHAKKPLFIFIGDEGLYQDIDMKSHYKAKLKTKVADTIEDVIDGLQDKFSVYCIRKPAGNSQSNIPSKINVKRQKQWERLLGPENVCILNEPRRVVDVILGIMAKESEKMDFYEKELEWRQTEDQVATVRDALEPLYNGGDTHV